MTETPEQPADFNPYAYLKAAATGDLSAQRRLAEASVEMARAAVADGPDHDPMQYLEEGLLFARMAAAHGGDGEKGLLIAMLALASDLCGDATKVIYDAQAIAIIELLADEGNDLANNEMPGLVEHSTPEAVQLAHFYKERMTA